MKKVMSSGLINRLRENKAIYKICLKELKNKKKKCIRHFSYPESLEFSRSNEILRLTNTQRLKEVVANINRSLKKYGGGISPFTKKELVEVKKRRDKREEKLIEHLFKLKDLRGSSSRENPNE